LELFLSLNNWNLTKTNYLLKRRNSICK